MQQSFKQLLQASFKSNDTEEWLDVHFTRPIGLVFALFWDSLGVHPNVITVLSIFLGAAAGVMFSHTELTYNILGVVLLMLANFCDSTDGQMARLTGKKTLVGRVLDGFSGDVWFFAIYVAIALRLSSMQLPGGMDQWGLWAWVLCIVAGVFCHAPQSSLADYYRQIHLFFLKGKNGSELDNSAAQLDTLHSLPKSNVLGRLFYYNYARYCKSQERRTPAFQQLKALWRERTLAGASLEDARQKFLERSRRLMPFTNILTFNTRAIVVYISCLTGWVWLYPVFELTVMAALYAYMHHSHEQLCRDTIKSLQA